MKYLPFSKRLFVQAMVALLCTAAVTTGVYRLSQPQPAPPVSPPPANSDIVFAENAPQLAAIAVSAVHAEPVPLAPPLAARVTYNENETARVSAPVAGRVTRLVAETGDKVRRGQTLARIDAPDMATAEADLAKAVADETRKNHAAVRAQTLFDGQVLASKDLEGAQADLAQARAETRRAQLRLRNLNATAGVDGLFDLKTPIDGLVTERQVNPGQEVRPDLAAPLFVVSNLKRLWVMVDVSEQLAPLLHAGQAARVTSDTDPGLQLPATVDHVAPMLDPVTRRLQVRCVVENAAGMLRPEMFVRVSFEDQGTSARAIVLPNASVFAEGRYSAVFVQVRPGTFRKRRIDVLRTIGDRTYIRAGLADGDAVVTEGAFLLTSESGNADPTR